MLHLGIEMNRVDDMDIGIMLHKVAQGQADVSKGRAEVLPPVAGHQNKPPPIKAKAKIFPEIIVPTILLPR